MTGDIPFKVHIQLLSDFVDKKKVNYIYNMDDFKFPNII